MKCRLTEAKAGFSDRLLAFLFATGAEGVVEQTTAARAVTVPLYDPRSAYMAA